MRVKLVFFTCALLSAVLQSAAMWLPPPLHGYIPAEALSSRFESQWQALRVFAKDVYPQNERMQKDAVYTLNYLFRDARWDRDHLDDFLRSGGLRYHGLDKDWVPVAEAAGHLKDGSALQPASDTQPTLKMHINRYLEAAKKYHKEYNDDVWKGYRVSDKEILTKLRHPPHQKLEILSGPSDSPFFEVPIPRKPENEMEVVGPSSEVEPTDLPGSSRLPGWWNRGNRYTKLEKMKGD
ncbi:conserved hypothetical Ustilaginaceae_specific protein [Sporisorium reilianum SRZ2]|uniref:Conserved hypothetical Ustilaginaceae_specific protein n=1 Tax=Sporisorium reilianum (strain SRZ2) TaxID=999809 RepID=E7A181_SPORE|nr:conserved hypothetical Ustilaginaceae_specific protein [Sporisorium reilianum SRZ2]